MPKWCTTWHNRCWRLLAETGFVTDDTKLTKLLKFPLTVYRGDPDGNLGMSWTLSKTTARFFAKRYGTGANPTIFRYVVEHKREVLAYFTGRNEAEIVLNPTLVRGYSEEDA